MRFLARAVVFLLATSVYAQNGAAGLAPGRASQPEFVGAYEPDGKFHRPCKRRTCAKYVTPVVRPAPGQIPPSSELAPRELVVEDIAPPARATRRLQPQGAFSAARDRLIALLYGREPVLRSPTHVVTDSRGRVIVSDPQRSSIHVLDGEGSFRIAGGPGRRLQEPNGIAVDAIDNIYVADGKLGMVLVYGPDGSFLRYLGRFRGESMFARPTGIAIHRESGRLYVLDTPANELIVLDLEGNVLNRAGGRRVPPGGVRFDEPTELAVNHHGLAVLDAVGSRIQVLDLDGHLVHSFRLRTLVGHPRMWEMALALDGAGNVYVSHVGATALRVYRPTGEQIGSLANLPGNRTAPSGAWIDSEDRLYLTDPSAGSIYVFRSGMAPSAGSRQLAAAGANQ